MDGVPDEIVLQILENSDLRVRLVCKKWKEMYDEIGDKDDCSKFCWMFFRAAQLRMLRYKSEEYKPPDKNNPLRYTIDNIDDGLVIPPGHLRIESYECHRKWPYGQNHSTAVSKAATFGEVKALLRKEGLEAFLEGTKCLQIWNLSGLRYGNYYSLQGPIEFALSITDHKSFVRGKEKNSGVLKSSLKHYQLAKKEVLRSLHRTGPLASAVDWLDKYFRSISNYWADQW
jgi:hypothetical protein